MSEGVVTMPVPTVPPAAQPAAPANHTRGLTSASYLVILGYLIWLPLMFAAGYWVYSWFDLDPSTGASLTSEGVAGWLAVIAFVLVAALPNWIGAWLATAARRAGAGRAATVALWLNLVLGLAYVAFMLIPGGL